MNLKVIREYKRFRKVCAPKAWTTYRALLCRLCQDHIQYDFSKAILGFTRNKQWKKLYDYADSLSEQKYPDAAQHFAANQFAALIRKYPFPRLQVDDRTFDLDPEAAAKEKFESAEAKCSDINSRFRSFGYIAEEGSLQRMADFVRYVLGDSPDLARIYDSCNFGPGANIGVHGNATNLARKIASDWSVTPSALEHSYIAVSRHYQMSEILYDTKGDMICYDGAIRRETFLRRCRVVRHNKIAFVPKTAKTHRVIAVEPLLNSYLQKGVDTVMRLKLKRIGIDLSDQEGNKELARQGSLSDSAESFVTIDLSSASDSISIELCRRLLPPDWYYLLDSIRSKEYLLDGSYHTYHKFCSMGNGFCFPLETLIFVAACVACDCGTPRTDFLVYGDDIIVRQKHASKLISLLKEIGFATNTSKTFLEGPFRESCGADWFGGEDVRPFTLDFALDSLESLFKFLNLSCRNEKAKAFFCQSRSFVISLIPPVLRFCRLHDGNPDTGYQDGQDEFLASPYTKWDKNHQCWSWLELLHLPWNDSWKGLRNAQNAYVMAALMGSSPDEPFTVRRKTKTTLVRIAQG